MTRYVFEVVSVKRTKVGVVNGKQVRRTSLTRVLKSDEAANQTHAGDLTEPDIRRLYETDNDRRALSRQMDRPDELSRICMGGGE